MRPSIRYVRRATGQGTTKVNRGCIRLQAGRDGKHLGFATNRERGSRSWCDPIVTAGRKRATAFFVVIDRRYRAGSHARAKRS